MCLIATMSASSISSKLISVDLSSLHKGSLYMSRLVFAPAHQLAQMIRDREVSAVEVLDAYLTQIATHNVKLNAICTLDEDRARQRAKQADEALFKGEIWGPLH